MPYRELIALLPCHSLEDFPSELPERPAASLLNAFTILWHPRLLLTAENLPRWVSAEDNCIPGLDWLIVVPLSCEDLGYAPLIDAALSNGATLIRGEHERDKLLAAALAPWESGEEIDPQLVADFFALGSTLLHGELLARFMRNSSQLDESRLLRDVLPAARAACDGDRETARKYLSRCFELLLECRERFYPVDCFLLDLCLSGPADAEPLSKMLPPHCPVNLLAAGKNWDELAQQAPELPAQIHDALHNQTVELIGGDDVETASTLLPLNATIAHLCQGHDQFRRLFSRTPVVWGRKRYGLGPHLPQILSQSGYTSALHLLLDDGIYPDDEQTNLRWDGSGGASIDAFSRIPLAADSAGGMLKLSRRMAESMDLDHSAAVLLVRWPRLRTPFLQDLQRAHTFAPVLGSFVTFSSFFAQATAPGRRGDFSAGNYLSPELVQRVARQQPDPVSRWVRQWELFRRSDCLTWLSGILDLARNQPVDVELAAEQQQRLADAHPDAPVELVAETAARIDEQLAEAVSGFRRQLFASGPTEDGTLLINPLSFGRRILISGGPEDPVPAEQTGVIQRQIAADSWQALVEVPPCGFLRLRNETGMRQVTSPGKIPLAEGLTLRNDQFEVQLSEVTGGIARIATYRRSPNRLSQQIAWRFPYERHVTAHEGSETESYDTWYSEMRLRESRILSAGPVVGEIETRGDMLDPQTGQLLGTWQQVTRVVRGKPIVEVELTLGLPQTPTGDPWTNYVGCRFAWKHDDAALTASMHQGAHAVRSQRIEAPQYIEIADESWRTTILTGGLPFHRRTGDRMLDTLLVVEGETARTFQLAIAIDVEYPLQAQLDAFSNPVICRAENPPGHRSQSGWFFQVSAPNVQLLNLLPAPGGQGAVLRLLETEGRGRGLSVHCFRRPVSAQLRDLQGRVTDTLTVVDDAVQLEMSPYQLCDVEVTFG